MTKHTAENDAPTYTREDMARAWREGAAAGHHSPLTLFALRQVNPYLAGGPRSLGG
jgi:hypothetical protein